MARGMFEPGTGQSLCREAGRPSVYAESVWPGSTSAPPGASSYANLMLLWLTNDTVPPDATQ